jgi:hypothetical protein
MSLATRATRLWSDRRLRIAVAVLAFAAVTGVTYLIAHYRMFSGFFVYDDEGYMLTALKGFVNHGDLYDRIFTQYGPFYYEAWGGLFSLFGIPVTHDSGRTVTMVAWIVSSLAIGLATMRIAGSLLLGLGTQMLVFAALGVASNEPMHPGGIICLLLAAIVAVSCWVRDRESVYAMAALGGVVAALVLVKINVGVFALLAVALACAVSYPVLSRKRWLRLPIEAAFVAMPVLLILGKLDVSWARHYAIHVSVAALAAVIVLRARSSEERPDGELRWLLGGFLLAAALICLTIVAAGTSPAALIEGVIGQPLRQADAFYLPMVMSRRGYAIDLLALGAAAAYWYATRSRAGGQGGPAWVSMISLFSIGAGIFIALSVNGKLLPFDTGLPGHEQSLLGFAWVALIPPLAPKRRPGVSFALLLLPLLAILQALHAYPVAGSQTQWAAFLLIPVGAICIANGVRGLASVMAAGAEFRAVAAFGALGAVVLLWFAANASLREPLRDSRAGYEGAVPLALPGSDSIRIGIPEAELYGQITTAIKDNCPALVMLPGMDSFYLWAEQEPPTGYTATGWPTLFDDAHQRRVIEDTSSIEGLCLLRNLPAARGWGNGVIPPGPLIRYLHRGFEPIARFGDYTLLQRAGSARASS